MSSESGMKKNLTNGDGNVQEGIGDSDSASASASTSTRRIEAKKREERKIGRREKDKFREEMEKAEEEKVEKECFRCKCVLCCVRTMISLHSPSLQCSLGDRLASSFQADPLGTILDVVAETNKKKEHGQNLEAKKVLLEHQEFMRKAALKTEKAIIEGMDKMRLAMAKDNHLYGDGLQTQLKGVQAKNAEALWGENEGEWDNYTLQVTRFPF